MYDEAALSCESLQCKRTIYFQRTFARKRNLLIHLQFRGSPAMVAQYNNILMVQLQEVPMALSQRSKSAPTAIKQTAVRIES